MMTDVSDVLSAHRFITENFVFKASSRSSIQGSASKEKSTNTGGIGESVFLPSVVCVG